MRPIRKYLVPLTLVLGTAAILIGQDKPEPQWLNTDLPEQHNPIAEWAVDEDCDCSTLFDSTSTVPVYEYDPDKGWILVWGEGEPVKPIDQ